MQSRQTRLLVTAPLMVLGLGTASAQTRQVPVAATAQSFSGVAATGTQVTIIDDAGNETRGRVLRVEPEALTIEVRRLEVTMERQHIAQIYQRGDSLKDGAFRGLVTGGMAGVLVGASMQNCGLFAYVSCTAADRATFAAVFGGVLGALGTGIGMGIDALVTGHRLLYENPAPRAAAFEIVPSFGRSRSGLALAIRW